MKKPILSLAMSAICLISSAQTGNYWAMYKGETSPTMDVGFGYLMGRDDFKKSLDFSMMIHTGFGIRYGFSDNLSGMATAGWRADWFSTKYKQNLTIHYITVPVHLRYHIPSSQVALIGGVRFNFAIAGKLEEGSGSSKTTIPFSTLKEYDSYNGTEIDLEFGLNIWGGFLKYGLSLAETFKDQKTQYITIGWEF